MSYWDTSALAKLYVSEPDSLAFRAHALAVGVSPVTARLAILEMRRVVFSKEAAGLLQPGTAQLTLEALDRDVESGEIVVVAQSDAVESEFDGLMAFCYRQIPPLPLRTLDALHLATARAAGETEIVATDHRLRQAALRLSFTVFPD